MGILTFEGRNVIHEPLRIFSIILTGGHNF